MRELNPRLHALASRLVEYEARGRREPEALAVAIDVVFKKLGVHLEKIVGPAGFQALARRALAHAALDLHFLAPVRLGPDGGLNGLRESVLAQRSPPPEEEFVAVPALFLTLLATFVGEELTLRLVRRTWPEIRLGPATTEEAE